MSTSPSSFDPLWMFRGPLGGDVMQRIATSWFSPSLTVNYAGDPAVEDRVVKEALGAHLTERFLEAKRNEVLQYNLQVSPWEIDTYLGRY